MQSLVALLMWFLFSGFEAGAVKALIKIAEQTSVGQYLVSPARVSDLSLQ